jgi:hypothetical protein
LKVKVMLVHTGVAPFQLITLSFKFAASSLSALQVFPPS